MYDFKLSINTTDPVVIQPVVNKIWDYLNVQTKNSVVNMNQVAAIGTAGASALIKAAVTCDSVTAGNLTLVSKNIMSDTTSKDVWVNRIDVDGIYTMYGWPHT